jgi:Cellulose synthase subunit D
MTVRAANNPFEGTTLDVAAKRSCAPQWRAFMEALSTTLSEVAGDELALRILGGVGAAIAKHHPVPVCSSLADLKTALNTALGVLDWGQVDIKEADKALEFVVIGYPFFESVDAQAAFAATLEALLDGWLTMQATRPGLTMRLVDRGRGAYPPLVFRYERTNSP